MQLAGDSVRAVIDSYVQNVVGKGNIQLIDYTADPIALMIAQVQVADQPTGWAGRKPYGGRRACRE